MQAATLAVFAFSIVSRHRLGVDVEAKAPMAVDHGRGRRFLHDGPFRAGHDMAGLDAVDIGRDRDHAVRVMAGEVGVDAADRDRVGFLVRRAGGLEQRRADAGETVGLDDRHGISSNVRPRRSGSCLLSLPAWSQSDGLRARAESPDSHAAGPAFPGRISSCGIGHRVVSVSGNRHAACGPRHLNEIVNRTVIFWGLGRRYSFGIYSELQLLTANNAHLGLPAHKSPGAGL